MRDLTAEEQAIISGANVDKILSPGTMVGALGGAIGSALLEQS